MASSDTFDSILTPSDARDLNRRGLAFKGDNGTMRLHKRRLNAYSDQEYSHIPLDVDPGTPSADSAFSVIPERLISHATLEYIGFNPRTADALWDRWTNWPEGTPHRETDPDGGGLQMTFVDFALGHIDSVTDTFDEDDHQWVICMDACGISQQVQTAILDPHFKYLRQSESCLHWIKDTIEMRYEGLHAMQSASINSLLHLIQAPR
ncbi:hypothetical protein B0I35DRAFT_409272 [Stachybotrys elegans]|uniref:Uncharacterized protein n=1 Tax=Stachybotrys elegans TaxID=80388 RepID=A0A8K0WRT1_9HYPO|nr:hypothetical protein B0I35DRAFT_409272 [Stachybotrys elegans]